MKILKMMALVGVLLVIAAPQAFAADAATGGGTNWVAITSGFAMAFAAAFAALGQGRVASAACEGLARNPGAAAPIRLALILGLVFIETLALFTLLIVFTKVA
jgi:F-type H+-transporting ATPase subunit c